MTSPADTQTAGRLAPYAAVLGARFRCLLQYRAAAIAGFSTQLFWGLVRCMIFTAFYHSATKTPPMRLDQTITYIWLGQALFALLPWQVDPDVRDMVRTGSVAYEMLRPVDLYAYWYSRALAARIAPTLLRAAPMLAVAALVLGLHPPATVACGFAWTVATVGAALLASAFTTLLTISLLWTTAGEGVSRLAPSIVYLFSGMVIPLIFFPPWCQPLLNALPFRDLIDVPFRIYLGLLPPATWPALFLQEAAWIAVLVIAGRIALARSLRGLVVQGG